MVQPYSEVVESFFGIFRQIYELWRLAACTNETIPEKMAQHYVHLSESWKQDLSNVVRFRDTASEPLQDFGLRLINLFLQSTYEISQRIRSR